METDNDVLSLVTLGLFLNNTTHNQGNHCIIAANLTRPPVDEGNQALLAAAGQCQELGQVLGPLLLRVGFLAFRQMAWTSATIGG